MLLDHLYEEKESYLGMATAHMPEIKSKSREELRPIPWIDTFLTEESWDSPLGLKELASVRPVLSERAIWIPCSD